MGNRRIFRTWDRITETWGWNWEAACGAKGHGDYGTEKEAEVARRLHELACKDC